MPAPFMLTPRKAPKPSQLLPLIAVLAFVLMMSNFGWADSCSTVSLSLSGPPITCTLPEQTPEVALTTPY